MDYHKTAVSSEMLVKIYGLMFHKTVIFIKVIRTITRLLRRYYLRLMIHARIGLSYRVSVKNH